MRRAFTLFECVLVLVLAGLIFSIVRFYPQKDLKLYAAALQIVNDIAYTRNLALIQGSFRSGDLSVATKDEWFKSRWQLYFIRSKSATNNDQTYTIFLDKNGDGNANLGKTNVNVDREIAVDILNANKLMNSGQSGVISKEDEKASKRFNLTQNFGVQRVDFKGSCSGSTRLVFDEYARLYSPLKNSSNPYDKNLLYNKNNCIVRLRNSTSSLCIVVDNLSSYAYIPKITHNNIQLVELNNKMLDCSLL